MSLAGKATAEWGTAGSGACSPIPSAARKLYDPYFQFRRRTREHPTNLDATAAVATAAYTAAATARRRLVVIIHAQERGTWNTVGPAELALLDAVQGAGGAPQVARHECRFVACCKVHRSVGATGPLFLRAGSPTFCTSRRTCSQVAAQHSFP